MAETAIGTMKPRKLILTALFAWFAAQWMLSMKRWHKTGKAPSKSEWHALEVMASILLFWFAFDTASRMLKRAKGRGFVLPPAKSGKTPSISAILKANPEYREILEKTQRESVAVALEWQQAEQKHVAAWFAKAAQSPKRLFPPFDPKLFEKSIDYRIRRFRRDRASRMVGGAQDDVMNDPEVAAFFPLYEYLSREDARVRPTHHAMHGFIARSDNEVWEWCTPACGYGCRCVRKPLARTEAIKRGLMTPDGKFLFAIRWPNERAQANYRRGIPFHGNDDAKAVPKSLRGRIFPDPGPWMLPKSKAVPL